MFRRFPVHPFLIGLFPVLFLFAQNPSQVGWADILLPLLVVEFIIFDLLIILYLFLKDWVKSGNFVSFGTIWFFSYGYFYNSFIGLTVNNIVIGRERLLFPVWFVFLIAGFFFLAKTRKHQDFNKSLNFVLPVLICVSLFRIGSFYFSPHDIGRDTKKQDPAEVHRVITKGGRIEELKNPPSIYYIILDAYSANSTLKDIYGYDNSGFLSFLKNKGFYVAGKSRSNYAVTGLSLPSSLNFNYLDSIFDLDTIKESAHPAVIQGVDPNEVMDYFSRRGYKVIQLGTWWKPTASERRTSGLKGYIATEFNMVLLQMTVLRPVAEQLMAPMVREGIAGIFDKMSELARDDKPHFVFAHILCPHPPFVFGPDGERVSLVKTLAMRLNPKSLYIDQLRYINKRVESLVDRLLKDSKTPPIIIIQADHGSGVIFHSLNNSYLPGNSKEDVEFLRSQFRILNAYYLPGEGEKYLYEDISPVNTFRVVLNKYFGEELELLPDRSYYSNYVEPYEFIDVTDKVRY